VEIVRQRSCVPVSACHNLSVISYDTMSYTMSCTMSNTKCVHLTSCVLSAGLFHWKKGLAYSVIGEGLQVYHDVPENILLNDIFFYVLYHLSSFQDMQGPRTPSSSSMCTLLCKSFTMSDDEEDKDGEGAGTAADAGGKVAAVLPPLQMQRPLRQKLTRFDLCAYPGIKSTAMQKAA
jgi:hypothetical protein